MKQVVKSSKKGISFFKKKIFIFIVGIIVGGAVIFSFFGISYKTSKDESCMACHVHPHVEDTWKQSVHYNNGSGTKDGCVDCHLPP